MCIVTHVLFLRDCAVIVSVDCVFLCSILTFSISAPFTVSCRKTKSFFKKSQKNSKILLICTPMCDIIFLLKKLRLDMPPGSPLPSRKSRFRLGETPVYRYTRCVPSGSVLYRFFHDRNRLHHLFRDRETLIRSLSFFQGRHLSGPLDKMLAEGAETAVQPEWQGAACATSQHKQDPCLGRME